MAQPLYSTSVRIDAFRGMNQTGDGANMNMQYAREIENVSVTGGSFRPMREGIALEPSLEKPIGTLAYVSCRFGHNAGKTILMAISDGHVYTKFFGGDDDWIKQPYPVLSDDHCDWLTYETSTYPPFSELKTYRAGQRVMHEDSPDVWKPYECIFNVTEPGEWQRLYWYAIQEDPVDMLIFTNATDGMFCLYADWVTLSEIETPHRFGVIARYNERIWGCGIDGDPDMLQYSAPYDPYDWEQNYELPEQGAGDILLPTWDGDSFQALEQYGTQLVALKKNSVWRIYGTDPESFVIQRQYGGGTIEENTMAIFNDRAYMLGESGLMIYDGTGCYPFQQEALGELMRNQVNKDVLNASCAGWRGPVYCLALPINGSEFCNAVLEYNTEEQTFTLRTQLSVDSFLQIGDRLLYTSATEPGQIYELSDQVGRTLPCKWVSGYQDLGMKHSIKSAFIVYMMVDSEAPVELRVGIRTEKKLKQKIVMTKPGKMTRLHLNLTGRIFRLEIQSYSAVPFTISGGVKIDLELDPD